jgi:hypothetical protein
MSGSTRLTEPPSSIGNPECIATKSTFDLPALQDIDSPLAEEDFIGEPHQTLISFPTHGAFHFFQNNAQLSERRAEAINMGLIYLDKYHLRDSSRPFSHRLLKDIFDDLSNRLDELLLNIIHIKIEDRFTYTIRKDYYQKVQAGLLKIKSKLGDILLANGVPIPDLPFWGPLGDSNEFYTPNNFEILGICYRTEVETFLSIFNEYYNFQTGLAHSPDLQDPLPTPPPQAQPQPQRETPPHQTSPTPSNNQSMDQGNQRGSLHDHANPNPVTSTPAHAPWFQNDLIGMWHQQSNIYHMEDGTARASQAQQHSQTQTSQAPPTSKMHEVLNNISQTFQDAECQETPRI